MSLYSIPAAHNSVYELDNTLRCLGSFYLSPDTRRYFGTRVNGTWPTVEIDGAHYVLWTQSERVPDDDGNRFRLYRAVLAEIPTADPNTGRFVSVNVRTQDRDTGRRTAASATKYARLAWSALKRGNVSEAFDALRLDV